MNKFMTSTIAVLVFISKLDVSEKRYTLILKIMNTIQIWKYIGNKASMSCFWIYPLRGKLRKMKNLKNIAKNNII